MCTVSSAHDLGTLERAEQGVDARYVLRLITHVVSAHPLSSHGNN